ncbi:MAG: PKD domain-containing protein, partial [Gammaproteobacteria bacterium]|nr:PKD domain-containing protein [Gammaproteobacteria bacterium]
VDLAGTNVKVNTPPVADAGPNHVCCLETVSEFDGSKSFDADGDNLTYTWDFGDGNTGEGAQVTHVYTTIGKFVVTLTVNDNSGTRCDTATDSFTAVVNATPTSVIKIR